MKTILLLLVFASLSLAQQYTINQSIFYNYSDLTMSTSDTVASITSIDSVEVQMGANGPWKLLTKAITTNATVTAADKSAESAIVFNLAKEDYWGHANEVRFRIYSTGIDTAVSYWQNIGNLNGALVLDIVPDTVGTNTHYSKSILHGN